MGTSLPKKRGRISEQVKFLDTDMRNTYTFYAGHVAI
jgi:hypothetical protein